MQMRMTKPSSYSSPVRAAILTADKFEDTELVVPMVDAWARTGRSQGTEASAAGPAGY